MFIQKFAYAYTLGTLSYSFIGTSIHSTIETFQNNIYVRLIILSRLSYLVTYPTYSLSRCLLTTSLYSNSCTAADVLIKPVYMLPQGFQYLLIVPNTRLHISFTLSHVYWVNFMYIFCG